MAALPEPLLMTVEEFNALPEETGEFYYELHFGELVEVSRAKKRHAAGQRIPILGATLDLAPIFSQSL